MMVMMMTIMRWKKSKSKWEEHVRINGCDDYDNDNDGDDKDDNDYKDDNYDEEDDNDEDDNDENDIKTRMTIRRR